MGLGITNHIMIKIKTLHPSAGSLPNEVFLPVVPRVGDYFEFENGDTCKVERVTFVRDDDDYCAVLDFDEPDEAAKAR